MRYRLPDGCVAVTLAGVRLDNAGDGTIEADAAAAAELAPHGIVCFEDRMPNVDAERPARPADTP